jgi:GNAT superfamily N-acetyltransferase
MGTRIHLRRASPGDVEAIRHVEIAAGTLFLTIGMAHIASDSPPTRRLLRTALDRDLLWVAVADGDGDYGHEELVVAYGLGSQLDGHLHLEQVSVRPDYGRRGIGAQIFSAFELNAARAGMPMSTLFTFADVPWNAPYYRRLGYRELRADAFGPQLANALMLEKKADGDGPSRIAMYRTLVTEIRDNS